MEKIIGSNVNLDLYNTFFAVEFSGCIDDLIDTPEVRSLEKFGQHFNTTRLRHSMNVAYYSYVFSKILHCDYRSAARAGLLHDLFYYDWRVEKQEDGKHVFAHPKAALKNANKLTELNEIERDAIVKHMWPLCTSAPKFKESFIVSMADKYCAIGEIGEAIIRFLKRRKRSLWGNQV